MYKSGERRGNIPPGGSIPRLNRVPRKEPRPQVAQPTKTRMPPEYQFESALDKDTTKRVPHDERRSTAKPLYESSGDSTKELLYDVYEDPPQVTILNVHSENDVSINFDPTTNNLVVQRKGVKEDATTIELPRHLHKMPWTCNVNNGVLVIEWEETEEMFEKRVRYAIEEINNLFQENPVLKAKREEIQTRTLTSEDRNAINKEFQTISDAKPYKRIVDPFFQNEKLREWFNTTYGERIHDHRQVLGDTLWEHLLVGGTPIEEAIVYPDKKPVQWMEDESLDAFINDEIFINISLDQEEREKQDKRVEEFTQLLEQHGRLTEDRREKMTKKLY